MPTFPSLYGWGLSSAQEAVRATEIRSKNFERIIELIVNTPHLKIRKHELKYPDCILEFENPKIATLFALNFSTPYPSYFPTDGKPIPIIYDASYACGLRSLNEHAEHLKNRRVVFLVDCDAVTSYLPHPSIPGSLEQRHVAIENHTKQITASAIEKGINPEELIVCYTSGCGGEDLYGALGGFSLREQGYIVFPEGILDHFVWLAGVPDLIAVKLGVFQDKLIEEGIIEYGGFIPEFEMLEIFGKCTRRDKVEEEKALAVEVEPGKRRASGGRKQLAAYMSTGHFNHSILVCPGLVNDEKYEDYYPGCGYITWDDKNKEVPPYFPEKSYQEKEKLNEVLTAAKKLVSLMLIKNLTTEKLLKIYGNKSIFNTIEAFMRSPSY